MLDFLRKTIQLTPREKDKLLVAMEGQLVGMAVGSAASIR